MTLIVRRRDWHSLERLGDAAGGAESRIRYSKYLGFHADEDGGLEDPRLVTTLFELCQNFPANMNTAQALWRHIIPANYSELLVQRQAAAALGCEGPTIILVVFTTADPGSDDPVTRAAQQAVILANLPAVLAQYGPENPIFGVGNLNADNYMVLASANDRNTAWWAFEAEAIKLIQDLGYRWCATDDQGLSSLCQTVVARRAAWTAEGVTIANCQFFAAHSYVVSGYVPAHLLLAERSFSRVSVTTPIRQTELAFDFFRVDDEESDRPWMWVDDDPTFPQALTWTRLMCEWQHFKQKYALIFDSTMFVRNYGSGPTLSPWGTIFTTFQRTQPAFVEPAALSLWFNGRGVAFPGGVAQTRAYALALSNGGTLADAEEAYDSVAAGNLFTIPALVPGTSDAILLESGDNILMETGDLVLME